MNKAFKENIVNIFGMNIGNNEIFKILHLRKENFHLNEEWKEELGYSYYESFSDGISILYIEDRLNTLFLFPTGNDIFSKTNFIPFNAKSFDYGVANIEINKLYRKKEILNNGKIINYIINEIKLNVSFNDYLEIDLISLSLEE